MSLKYQAGVNEIGNGRDVDLCTEVRDLRSENVNMDRIAALDTKASSDLGELNQANYAELLSRLSPIGRDTVSTFVENELGKNMVVTKRVPRDKQFLEANRKAIVFLSQSKCSDLESKAGDS